MLTLMLHLNRYQIAAPELTPAPEPATDTQTHTHHRKAPVILDDRVRHKPLIKLRLRLEMTAVFTERTPGFAGTCKHHGVAPRDNAAVRADAAPDEDEQEHDECDEEAEEVVRAARPQPAAVAIAVVAAVRLRWKGEGWVKRCRHKDYRSRVL